MAWSIRNYNTFLRETVAELDVSRGEAQQLYRDVRDVLDRALYGTDAVRHLDYLTYFAVERGFILGPGAELEMTATTKGGTPKEH